MTVQVGAPGDITTPPAGSRELFIDSTNNFLASLKHSDGSVTLFSEDADGDCCACAISKIIAEAMSCALQKGMVSPDDYNAWILQGFTVTAEETDDGEGNKTCTVSMGPKEATVDPSGVGFVPSDTGVAMGTPKRFYPQFTPSNTTNQAVVWTSSDPTIATVAADGTVTPVAPGETVLRMYSVADMTLVSERTMTIS